MLDKGIESQGVVHKEHDKYGKRMYVATPVEAGRPESHMPVSSIGSDRKATNEMGVDSNTKREDVGGY